MTLVAEHIEGDTRDRILEVAERLFRQIGYQKTTVGDIAKELRMSHANVNRFFESKKAISPGGGAGPGEQDGCLLEPLNASVNAKSNDEKNHGAVGVRIPMVFDAPESGLDQ